MKRGLVLLVALGLGLGACSSGGGTSVASFCSVVKKEKHLTDTNTGSGLDALKKVASAAPSAIKSDMNAFVNYVENVSLSQKPSPADIAKLNKTLKNVTTYVKNNCHVDLTSTT